MSNTRNIEKFSYKNNSNYQTDASTSENYDDNTTCDNTTEDGCSYSITTSNKDPHRCSKQRSFISIHSTDQCQLTENRVANLKKNKVEILNLNKVFASTSEESLATDDGCKGLKTYVPTNSKSSTGSGRVKRKIEMHGGSEINIPNTMHVVGSNPGEPKMRYDCDNTKKLSKNMKKLIRKMDKQRTEGHLDSVENSVLLTRGILKERCLAECTGDSSNADKHESNNEIQDYEYYKRYNKNIDKNVKFYSQVMIVHLAGDLCLGESVETLCKEKDQQERNSELRKTFLTKYNELWSKRK